MVLGQQQRLDQHLLIRRVVMVFLLLCCAAGGCVHAAATVTARHCLPLRTAGNSQAAHVPRSCGSQQHPGKHTGKYHSGCRFLTSWGGEREQAAAPAAAGDACAHSRHSQLGTADCACSQRLWRPAAPLRTDRFFTVLQPVATA